MAFGVAPWRFSLVSCSLPLKGPISRLQSLPRVLSQSSHYRSRRDLSHSWICEFRASGSCFDTAVSSTLSSTFPFARSTRAPSGTPEMYYRNHSWGDSTSGFRFYVQVDVYLDRPLRRNVSPAVFRRTTGNREVPRADVRGSRESPKVWGLFRKLHFVTHVWKECARIVESESQYSRRARGEL